MKAEAVKDDDIANFNKVLANCIYNAPGAKLQSPIGLETKKTNQPLVKVTFSSAIWGFIDDMTLKIHYDFTQNKYFTVYTQSELRVGVGDMGKNIAHTKSVLMCLDMSKELLGVTNICEESK